MGWIAVDLDKTLAHSTGKHGSTEIGPPIPEMLLRVQSWLAQGKDVRIFTARAAPGGNHAARVAAVKKWCKRNLGVELPVTATKDPQMVALYDDRAYRVIPNTGKVIGKKD